MTAEPQSPPGCQAETHILDLTVPLPPSTEGGRYPGAIYGGGVGSLHREGRRYSLPFRIAIRDVKPELVADRGKITICLSLENAGSSSFDLPASRVSTHKDGNKNRKSLQVWLRIGLDGQADPILVLSAVLSSSTTVKDSFIRLAPGETIGIKFDETVKNIRAKMPPDVMEIQLAIAVDEWISEDSQYFIKFDDSRSQTVVSSNSVRLPVVPE